jgi:purine-cytosine permease-like protein
VLGHLLAPSPSQTVVEFSPIGYLVPLLIITSIGNIGNLGLSTYNSGLDLQAILWRLERLQVQVVMCVVTVGLSFLFTVVVGAQDTISAVVTIVLVLITPWTIINLVGFVMHRGRFDVLALHAFDDPKGHYWYQNGWNLPAVGAWLVGVVVGLLFTHSTIFSGPLDNVTNGVDISFTSAAVVSAVVYLVLRLFLPHGSRRSPSSVAERAPVGSAG